MFLSVSIFIILPIVFLILTGVDMHRRYTSIWTFSHMIVGIIWAIILVFIVLVRFETKQFIAQFREVRANIEYTRSRDEVDFESAAIYHKIVEYNSEMARKQYVANINTLKIFYPKELLQLKSIK